MGKKEKGTSNPCQQDPKAQQSKQGESCTTEKQVKKPFQPANPGQSGKSWTPTTQNPEKPKKPGKF